MFELVYENFDELLRYIVYKKIKVKTDNPKEFVKAQNRIIIQTVQENIFPNQMMKEKNCL